MKMKRLAIFGALCAILSSVAFGESVTVEAKTGSVKKTSSNLDLDFQPGTKVGGVPIGTGDGRTILNGTTVPSNGLGVDGDFYLRTTNYDFYGPKTAGVWGSPVNLIGSAGADGAAGSQWRSGVGTPSNGLGANGDFYLQTDSGSVWKKAAGNYSVIFNIKGSVWTTGSGAPNNAVGKDGDFYLRQSNGDVYLRTSGTYSVVMNLKGPTGATGTAGTNGTNGTNGAGYLATSTSSLLIAATSKSFTTQAGLAYTVGGRARASSAANTSNFMEGLVTSYSSTTLVINVTLIGGSGTFADWNINLAGNPGSNGTNGSNGSNGATGATGPGYLATSATSFSIGTGSKAFTTQAGLAYSTGARARASSTADTANYMEGLVTSYSSTTLTINVTVAGGSGGPFTDWKINLAGQPGQGVPVGGMTGQHLAKNSGSDYDTGWVNPGVSVVDSQTTDTLTWVSNGDANGVFYRLGTNFGAIAWTNPHTAGRLTVSASSLDNGTVADIVDRADDDVYTSNTPNSFFVFDLGPGRSLELTSWTYQSRNTQATQSTPTEMTLEGSNDGSAYTPIDVRTGISFTIAADWRHYTATSSGYRYFRLKQTAQNASSTDFFTIGEFELYGDLTHGEVFDDGAMALFQDQFTLRPGPVVLSEVATLNFGSTAAGASSDLTVTVTGAADSDPVSVGVPNASTLSNSNYTAWVSAADTVTVRFDNSDLINPQNPSSGTFRVTVFHY